MSMDSGLGLGALTLSSSQTPATGSSNPVNAAFHKGVSKGIRPMPAFTMSHSKAQQARITEACDDESSQSRNSPASSWHSSSVGSSSNSAASRHPPSPPIRERDR